MATCSSLLVLLLAPAAAILLRGTGSRSGDFTFELTAQLGRGGMQPDAVARLLSQVEKHWEEVCVKALRNQTDEASALSEMTMSCTKVAKAVVDGSAGEKDKVIEYMSDVCATAKSKKQCDQFSSGIEGFLRDDSEFNRNELDFPKFCQSFWVNSVTKAAVAEAKKLSDLEAQRVQQEAEQKQREQKEQDAAAAKAASEKEGHEVAQIDQESQEAVNMTQSADDDASKVNDEVKSTESDMVVRDENATKLVDKARQAVQAASEKEAEAAEAKAAAPADEAAAVAAGDAKAQTIADKAVAAMNQTQPAAADESQDNAAAKDENDAKAKGDELAEKIAEKATQQSSNTSQPVAAAAPSDDELAKAAGDALAQKIAEKATKKKA